MSDFWEMTLSEWVAYMDGWALKNEDAWRRTRLLYSIIYNVNVDADSRVNPEELFQLPSEKEKAEQKPRVKRLTVDECYKIAHEYGFVAELDNLSRSLN